MNRLVFDCDAVLFDMDGTLVDSREIVERMWTEWATGHDVPVESALALAHGRRTLETMQLLAPHLATPEEAARLDALESEQDGGETTIPGALTLLLALPPLAGRSSRQRATRSRAAGSRASACRLRWFLSARTTWRLASRLRRDTFRRQSGSGSTRGVAS